MGQAELLQMPQEALNHPGIIRCLGVSQACVRALAEPACPATTPGDTCSWFFSGSFALPCAVSLVQDR